MYESYQTKDKLSSDHAIHLRKGILYNLIGCKDLFLSSIDTAFKALEVNR